MGRDSGGDVGDNITYKDIPDYPDYQIQRVCMCGYRIVKRDTGDAITPFWVNDLEAASIMLWLKETNAN